MDIYRHLPFDIKNKLFLYFRHPTAEFIIEYRKKNYNAVLKELIEFHQYKKYVKKKFYKITPNYYAINWYNSSHRFLYYNIGL